MVNERKVKGRERQGEVLKVNMSITCSFRKFGNRNIKESIVSKN